MFNSARSVVTRSISHEIQGLNLMLQIPKSSGLALGQPGARVCFRLVLHATATPGAAAQLPIPGSASGRRRVHLA